MATSCCNWCLRQISGRLVHLLLVFLGLSIPLSPVLAKDVKLGPPPSFPKAATGLQVPQVEKTFEVLRLFATGALTVNPKSRAESLRFFTTYYLAADQPIGWAGNSGTCTAGTTLLTFKDLVLLRLNYFRAMAGVPAQVTFSGTYSTDSQQAALMMSANDAVSHAPPSSWFCYTTAGATAAASSDLALGVYGRDAMDLYMQDPDAGNEAVGHRRWVLYPQTQTMGTGDIPPNNNYAPSNSLWVFDGNFGATRPATREEFVAWPPPGYVPYQVAYARWSFSYANADFSAATVTMTQGGANVPVILEALPPPDVVYGENTLVWRPQGITFVQKIINPDTYPVTIESWPQPAKDTTYQVAVNNVKISGVAHNFSYNVTIFNPTSPKVLPLLLLLD
jgi:hypothetical protein